MAETMHHPAKYSPELYEPIRNMLRAAGATEGETCYDFMAGTGALAEIIEPLGLTYIGCELEPEWATMHPQTFCADCRTITIKSRLVCCSVPYGNRMADQFLGTPAEQLERAVSGKRPRRMSYAISLGRKLDPTKSAAALQWGPKYRGLMAEIYRHVVSMNMPAGGYIVMNVASHYRKKDYQPVAEWTLKCLEDLGLVTQLAISVPTRGMRDGQNRELRVGGEVVALMRKP